MTIKAAINGYGRIGRNLLRARYEGKLVDKLRHDIQIVAINDLGDPNTKVHLTQYDTVHGKFSGTISVDGNCIAANGDLSLGELKGIPVYNTVPLINDNFTHDPASSIFDATQMRVSQDGRLVKVQAWYDNEWAFSDRMRDTAAALMAAP
jgi:glyceraldehyde-3-phosphate dehydrogenase/erythrose-4-phosphate dehydrogenase